MNHQPQHQERKGTEQHDQNLGHEYSPRHEHDSHQLHPRIWISSLADYNNGRLHGQWIDATQSPEKLEHAALSILASSPEPDAEEWAIHDYDDFADVRLGEYESLEDVSAIAQGLAKHGPAFGAWANLCLEAVGNDPLDHELLAQFDEHYLGNYPNPAAWMKQEAAELDLEDSIFHSIPQHLQPYEALARDMELSGEVMFEEGEEGVWVFHSF